MSDKIHYSDKEFEQLLLRLTALMDELDQIKDPAVTGLVEQVLRHFDAVHREGFSRLAVFLESEHPEIMERIKNDYAIRHLLALYDLTRFEGIEEARDQQAFISEDDIKPL